MNIIVADSCALILLAKSGLLKALTEFRRVIVPAAKIATGLYRHGCIEGPLAKAAIEKMRIEGRYAPDIIAEALLRLKEIGNVETGNREDT